MFLFRSSLNTILLLFLFIFLNSNDIYAQKEGNIWYFGNYAGMDFNGGAPVPLTNGALSTVEGCASISDSNGNLLFYSDGVQIWNQNHLVMPNGSGLGGGLSSSQSAIIVKQPGSSTLYYVFTPDQSGGSLTYSVVDMTLQGGLGDVNANKNVLIVNNIAEKVTAVKHQNNIDFWIITQLLNTNSFHCYLLTSTGLSVVPVISNIGINIGTNYIGYIKASISGTRLGVSNRYLDNVEIFDFDKSTGILSNLISLDAYNPPGPYGVEFSPDETKFYVAEGSIPGSVYQYDLLAGTPVDILNSRVTLGSYSGWGGALQLGPDYKIYFAEYQSNYLGVISNPNSLGALCNFAVNGFYLGGQISNFGLPLIFLNPPVNITVAVNGICIDDSTYFTSTVSAYDSVMWNFGDLNSGIENFSIDLNPPHLFTDTGTFNVTLFVYYQGNVDSVSTSVNIISTPVADLGNDTTLCQGNTLTLTASGSNASYLWQDNSTAPNYVVSQPGTYWVMVTNACGFNIDSIVVDYISLPVVQLGNDTTLCAGTTMTLDATFQGATYIWQDSSTAGTFAINQPGVYWVNVTNNCGSDLDSIIVNYIFQPTVFIGNDTTICNGTSLLLNATNAGSNYLWQDNSSGSTFNVTQPGTYWVNVTNICGIANDSIVVNYISAPVVTIGNDTALCQGTTLTLDATVPNATYLWHDNSVSATYSVTQPGTYWVNVTNVCGSTIDSIVVNYISIPSIFLGNDTTICQGSTLLLNASNSGMNYLWQDNSTGATFNVTQAGTYWVNVSNVCGNDIDSIIVNFDSAPVVFIGNDTTLCQGTTITLDATSSGATYLWNNNSTSPTFTVNLPGAYWVNVMNVCGNSSDSIMVNYMALPSVFLGNDTIICDGSSITLDANNSNATYLWSDNSTNSQLTITQSGLYWVTVTNVCGNQYDTLEVSTLSVPSVFLGNDSTLCPDQSLMLDASSPGAIYLWQDGSDESSFLVNQSGIYWVQVENICGTANDSIEISPGDCEIILEMPNVFTPNNDGLNDSFYPLQIKGIEKALLVIFNRWGTKLFDTYDILTGWNGNHNGTTCEDGTYFWIVEYSDINQKNSVKKGNVMLLQKKN